MLFRAGLLPRLGFHEVRTTTASGIAMYSQSGIPVAQ